jgi:hypothetical protein
MRINEDFLDDLEQDDIASASVSVQDTRDDSAWPYVFRFESGEISNKRKPSFYIEKMERLHKLLVALLDKCPVVKDFNHDFIIYIGDYRDKDYNEMTTEHGITFRWPWWKENPCETLEEYFDPKVGRSTAVIISMGLDGKTDTMMQIRRLMLSLWKVFRIAFRIVYRSAGYPSSVYMKNDKFTVSCAANTESVWTSKNEREHKFFTEAYRAFHPEMKPSEIKPIIDEFTGQDSGLQKVLKKFRTDEEWKKRTGKQPYRLKNLVNGAKKVELMSDGRLNIHWGRKEYYVDDYFLISSKTRNKEYVLSDVTDLKYMFTVNWETAKPGLIKERCEWILRFCKNVAPEVKNVVLDVDGLALKEFINSSVDFRKLLPGLNVKVEVTSDEI